MLSESMQVRTESGIVNITLNAQHEDSMQNLREELFNWYEDFVEREISEGRSVQTSNTPHYGQEFRGPLYCEIVEKTLDGLKNMLDSARGYRTTNTRCGEVVELPMEFERFKTIVNDLIDILTPF